MRAITIIIFIVFILYPSENYGQIDKFDLQIPKLNYFYIEPLKPYNVGRLIVLELGEDYEERKKIYENKEKADFLNSENYINWIIGHMEWRDKVPNWREKTRYPELLSEEEEGGFINNPVPLPGEIYSVSVPVLYLRSEPKVDSEIQAKLDKGTGLTLLSAENKDWWLVETNRIKGYALAYYLESDPYFEWQKKNYGTGESPTCENITPIYDSNIDNYLTVFAPDNLDVVVKLMKKEYSKDLCIRIAYVRSGEFFKIQNIPEGLYYVKLAYGKDYRQKIVDNKCIVKFIKNTTYKRGVETLDFNLIKKPNIQKGNQIYEQWEVPSYHLKLNIRVSEFDYNAFDSKEITEEDFNR